MNTKEYYQEIAKKLEFDTDPFINGKFVKGGGPAFDSINPANGKVIATLSSNTVEEVYEAEKAAREAREEAGAERPLPLREAAAQRTADEV